MFIFRPAYELDLHQWIDNSNTLDWPYIRNAIPLTEVYGIGHQIGVTGIGHTKRELYSDDDDIIYEHRRIISISGINVVLTEPDALDRSIFIELPH